ncbi:hypothetical protein BC835DRAFT_1327165 [Cytidiella melzeri]|nr:hypothetical protein BC835DRAFT_1327165 [Cytidiella melzeri]
MTKHPSMPAVSFDNLAIQYGADDIINALVGFVAQITNPQSSRQQIAIAGMQIHLPMTSVPVFHRICISNPTHHEYSDTPNLLDAVHIQPARVDSRGQTTAGRFDTVLVDIGNGLSSDVSNLRVAQVRVVFSLKDHHCERLFGKLHTEVATHLAYVQWFSKVMPSSQHRLYKLKRCYIRDADTNYRGAEVIPVNKIRCSIQLFPQFGSGTAPRQWTPDNILEECETFYANPFTSDYTYGLL